LGGRPTSHEFHVFAPTGDDSVLHCTGCGYAANSEAATSAPNATATTAAQALQAQLAGDPFKLASASGGAWRAVDGDAVAVVVVPTGRHANPLAIRTALGCAAVERADEATVTRAVAAGSLRTLVDRAAGGTVSVATVHAGDGCPCCGKPLAEARGIEVGHVFYLGTKYSAPLQALVRPPAGGSARIAAEMGCFGIGVSRILAAAAEAHHDMAGLCWPVPLAPVHAVVIGARAQSAEAAAAAQALAAAGFDVLIDDRDLGPGARLRDARLMGAPLAVVAGREMAISGRLEVHVRAHGENAGQLVSVDGLVAAAAAV
jgi:prolyl-tRNA synthetase